MRSVILLISLLFPALLHGQDVSRYAGKQLPGYVVTRRGDTLRGTIRVNDLFTNQHRVVLRDQVGKRQQYVPFEVKEYAFFAPGTTPVRYMQLRWKGEYRLLQLTGDGYVKMYRYYYPAPTDRNPVPALGPLEKQWVLQKGDYPPTAFTWGKFYEQATAYFEDYPALADRIWTRKYKRSELPAVVMAYNQWHAGRP